MVGGCKVVDSGVIIFHTGSHFELESSFSKKRQKSKISSELYHSETDALCVNQAFGFRVIDFGQRKVLCGE